MHRTTKQAALLLPAAILFALILGMRSGDHEQVAINCLFNNITNLEEETDQSREETFAPLADDPLHPQPTHSPSSSYLKATMFTEKLSESIVKNDDKGKKMQMRKEEEKIELIELR